MRTAVVLCICLLATAARGDTALFYQPLNVDATVSVESWDRMLHRAREAGVDTLVVQWTRHGPSDFGGARGWLLQRLRAAEASGLQLVVGLYYDPRYYDRMARGEGVEASWYHWLDASLRQQHWLRSHAGLSPVAWYLPLELDDRLFARDSDRDVLASQLAVFREELDAPLHVSAFSAGVLAPERYADWLQDLPVERVWWQDGRGTGALTPEALDAYRERLDCNIGVVAEAFVQNADSTFAFSAEPAAPRLDTGCHPRAVFSLRYLPWGRALLDTMRGATP